jgi:protein-arginine kinase activator protein McsA
MFLVDIVNGIKIYSKVCSSCKQDTDYYQNDDTALSEEQAIQMAETHLENLPSQFKLDISAISRENIY